MIHDAALQDLRTKHNLNETEFEELSNCLQQMRDLPSSLSDRKMREEHRRHRRVLSFLARGNEQLERDVLYLLWQMSTTTKQRRIEERKKERDRRSDTRGIITI